MKFIIEPTTLCNAKCNFCSHRFKTRHRTMSMKEFRYIVDALKEGNHSITSICGIGEPLMDDTCFEKWKYAKCLIDLPYKAPFATNGILITEDKWDDIIQYIPKLYVSCYNTEKEYEKLTGLNWDVFYKNITSFLLYISKYKPEYLIYINSGELVGANINNVKKAFKDFDIDVLVNGVFIWDKENWRGITTCLYLEEFYRNLYIRVDGECNICCFDHNNFYSIGNIFKDSLSKILETFKNPDFEKLCSRCDYYQKHKYQFNTKGELK
jgi:sulfatase maturation enzyme AslB (radical SAM superfamily)